MNTNIITPNKNILRIVVVTALILLIPLVAMQFSNDVNWGIEDFVMMSILLMGAGLAFDFTMRKTAHLTHRAVIGGGLLIAFLLVWAQLAVGII